MKKYLVLCILPLCCVGAFSQSVPYFCSKHTFYQNHEHSIGQNNKSTDLAAYDIHYLKFDIELYNTSTYISGMVRTEAKVSLPTMDKYVFELHPSLTVDSVQINGVTLPCDTAGINRIVLLPVALLQDAEFVADVYYHGLPAATGGAAIGNGISSDNSPSWGNRVTWTLSEPYSAYEWWPCKQDLRDKIDSVDMHVTTADTLKVGSNGLLKNSVPLAGNKVRYEWASRYPIDYYLISVTVAKYVEYNVYAHLPGQSDSLLIQNYVYDNPQTLLFFKDSIDQTVGLIEHFSDIFGTYPFKNEKYGHCMAPFGGGMEHQTMTSLGSFNFSLIAHELAHQWFGDHVTCGSWKDLWVNEGFATYSSFLSFEYFRPSGARANMDDLHNEVMTEPDGSTYVYDTTDVGRVFSWRLTYCKGAAIIHMIRFAINNDDQFFQVCKNYQQQFAYSTAVGDDFKSVAENVSGMDFSEFFTQWYYGEGFPTFSLHWNQVGNNLYLRVSQTASMPSITPLFKTPLEIKINSTAGDTTVRFDLTQSDQTFLIPYSNPISGFVIDPSQWVLNADGSIIHDLTLGMAEINKQNIYVYPNPVTDNLNIKNIPVDSEIRMIDINGKLVFDSKPYSSNFTMDCTKLAKGVYTLELRSSTIRSKWKIVKQ